MVDLEKIKQEKPISELINFSILNIDKPENCTSFDVVEKIRKLFDLNKAGHFGTLDPMVTGVLPVCLGNACKIQEFFMHRDKTYIGKMKLHKEIKQDKLEGEMKKFLGKINQLPPVKSSVKRQLREREVMEFKLLNYNEKKREAEFIAKVEAGTYIRKLISDLGLGIGGAQMSQLRRIQAGIFSDKNKDFITIEQLEKIIKDEKKLRELLIPAEIISKILPSIQVDSEIQKSLINGSPIFDNVINLDRIENEIFCIFCNNQLIEIAKKLEKPVKSKISNIIARPIVVFN